MNASLTYNRVRVRHVVLVASGVVALLAVLTMVLGFGVWIELHKKIYQLSVTVFDLLVENGHWSLVSNISLLALITTVIYKVARSILGDSRRSLKRISLFEQQMTKADLVSLLSMHDVLLHTPTLKQPGARFRLEFINNAPRLGSTCVDKEGDVYIDGVDGKQFVPKIYTPSSTLTNHFFSSEVSKTRLSIRERFWFAQYFNVAVQHSREGFEAMIRFEKIEGWRGWGLFHTNQPLMAIKPEVVEPHTKGGLIDKATVAVYGNDHSVGISIVGVNGGLYMSPTNHYDLRALAVYNGSYTNRAQNERYNARRTLATLNQWPRTDVAVALSHLRSAYNYDPAQHSYRADHDNTGDSSGGFNLEMFTDYEFTPNIVRGDELTDILTREQLEPPPGSENTDMKLSHPKARPMTRPSSKNVCALRPPLRNFNTTVVLPPMRNWSTRSQFRRALAAQRRGARIVASESSDEERDEKERLLESKYDDPPDDPEPSTHINEVAAGSDDTRGSVSDGAERSTIEHDDTDDDEASGGESTTGPSRGSPPPSPSVSTVSASSTTGLLGNQEPRPTRPPLPRPRDNARFNIVTGEVEMVELGTANTVNAPALTDPILGFDNEAFTILDRKKKPSHPVTCPPLSLGHAYPVTNSRCVAKGLSSRLLAPGLSHEQIEKNRQNIPLPGEPPNHYIDDFIEQLVTRSDRRGIPKPQPEPYSECYKRQNGPLRKLKTFRGAMATDYGKTKTSMMVKKEPYTKCSDYRIINITNDSVRYHSSRYSKPLADWVKATTECYGFQTPRKVRARLVKMFRGKTHLVGLGTDLSRMDATINVHSREVVLRLLLRLFPDSTDDVKRMYSCLMNNRMKYVSFDDDVQVEAKQHQQQLSGDNFTSVSNTLVNMFHVYVALRWGATGRPLNPSDAFDALGIYAGDDGMTLVKEEKLQYVVRSFGYNGMKTTTEDVCRYPVDNPRASDSFAFLGRVYGPGIWHGDGSSFCDLDRSIQHLHLGKPGFGNDEILAMKCLSVLCSDYYTPYIGPWVKRLYDETSMSLTSKVYERAIIDRALGWNKTNNLVEAGFEKPPKTFDEQDIPYSSYNPRGSVVDRQWMRDAITLRYPDICGWSLNILEQFGRYECDTYYPIRRRTLEHMFGSGKFSVVMGGDIYRKDQEPAVEINQKRSNGRIIQGQYELNDKRYCKLKVCRKRTVPLDGMNNYHRYPPRTHCHKLHPPKPGLHSACEEVLAISKQSRVLHIM